IESRIVKQMLVKYYSSADFVNINTYTIKILNDILKLDIKNLTVYSYITYNCMYFGSRKKISEKYEVKTKGKQEKKIIYKSPYDITLTNEDNSEIFSEEEINISKVILNGLYGIPALRSCFNLFRWNGS